MVRRTLLALAAVAFVMWAAPASADDLKAGTHEGKVVKVDANKLTMSDKEGKNEHTHTIPADAKISLDGKDAKLADLKAGTAVRVTVEKKGDKTEVTKIEGGKSK